MRLFLAIDIPDEIYKTRLLNELIADIGRIPSKIHAPEKMHITLAFLDEVDEASTPHLVEILKKVTGPKFNLKLAGVGVFDSIKQPHVIFIGTSNPPELTRLAETTRGALEGDAFFFDPKPFRPHVTIARIKDIHWHEFKERKRYTKEQQKILHDIINKYEHQEFGSFTVDHFSLIASAPTEHGHVYSELAQFPLA